MQSNSVNELSNVTSRCFIHERCIFRTLGTLKCWQWLSSPEAGGRDLWAPPPGGRSPTASAPRSSQSPGHKHNVKLWRRKREADQNPQKQQVETEPPLALPDMDFNKEWHIFFYSSYFLTHAYLFYTINRHWDKWWNLLFCFKDACLIAIGMGTNSERQIHFHYCLLVEKILSIQTMKKETT